LRLRANYRSPCSALPIRLVLPSFRDIPPPGTMAAGNFVSALTSCNSAVHRCTGSGFFFRRYCSHSGLASETSFPRRPRVRASNRGLKSDVPCSRRIYTTGFG
jgi:hypothetical protein